VGLDQNSLIILGFNIHEQFRYRNELTTIQGWDHIVLGKDGSLLW